MVQNDDRQPPSSTPGKPESVSRRAFKKNQSGKPIVIIGGGVNGSAVAMELARELRRRHSRQRVVLLDMYGYPDPARIENSSRGDTRITRMSNAEHVALTHTAIDTARFYTQKMRQFNAPKTETDRKIRNMLNDRYEGTMLYKPHGFVFTMPRGVGQSREFHGHSNTEGNAYERTLRNARANGIHHETMEGYDFAARFPGFTIAEEDKNQTDVYYEPQCLETDERKDSWFPTGGTLYAERCVATHLALFEAYGGEFRPYTEAAGIAAKDGGATVTLQDGSSIEASKVVIAANKEANPFLPTMMKVSAQRQIVGFFKGENMSALSSDGPDPLPSFIIYFRTPDNRADYAYGIPATKHSILYKDFFKAARENGYYGDMSVPAYPVEEDALFEFTTNFARISGRDQMRSLICGYGGSKLLDVDGELRSGVQVWSRHPQMSNCYVVHNCDGGGFKHAAGAGRQFARLILGLEPSNPNINLERDFSFARNYVMPVNEPNPQIEERVRMLSSKLGLTQK